MICNYCGREGARFINPNGTGACEQCATAFNTCNLCLKSVKCEFEQNPDPMPKQIQQTIRQGNMRAQTVVKNPERVNAFCTHCPCWNTLDSCCNREFGCCGRYDEFIPSPILDEENSVVAET